MKILLIEDDLRVSNLIQRGLNENGFHTELVYDGMLGLKLANQYEFDLIITDIILPKMDGLELCKKLRELNNETPILMLTALGTTDDKVEGFDAGADDYLVKPFEMRELLARVRALIKRKNNQHSNYNVIIKYDTIELNTQTKIVKREGRELSLTPKEFKLFEFMLLNPERVLMRSEISEKVWETHFDTGTNFIDVYINYLRKKVDKDFDTKLIHTKPGMGFILKREL